MSNQRVNVTRRHEAANSGLVTTRRVHELEATGPEDLGSAEIPVTYPGPLGQGLTMPALPRDMPVSLVAARGWPRAGHPGLPKRSLRPMPNRARFTVRRCCRPSGPAARVPDPGPYVAASGGS